VYDYLEGQIALHSATRLVVDVGGVGYELSTPLGYAWTVGRRARVWAHQIVRADAHLLYGFPDADTRDLFRVLLTVTGVGPRLALGILSGLPRRELLEAIAQGDRRRLLALRGIGKRTVDQVLLQLSDKARELLAAERASGAEARAAPGAALPRRVEDAIAALISIGYADKDARRQVERAAATLSPDADLELLVRTALSA